MSTLIKVGAYQLCYRPVELFVDTSSSGGSGDFVPGEPGEKVRCLSRIVVGVKGVRLWSAWGMLVHEVVEMALCDHRASYSTSGVFHKSTEERSFFFDHRTFTRVCDEAGNYLFECKADFDRAYRKARRKPPARKKRK